MELQVNGHDTYCYTGGKTFDPSKPTVVFLHGVLNDHSVWILQTRYLAHHGFGILAPDLPGHCRSAGEPPKTVQEAADFVLALLDAAGVQRAALVGHSLGSLIALEVASRAPKRVTHLALLGTASPMRVSPALLENSISDPLKAIEMVNVFSHATLAPPPSALGPGTWVYGSSKALMKRVLASNPRVNLFHTGFKACDDYRDAQAAMEKVECPLLFIVGNRDSMNPPRLAEPLQTVARQGRTVRVDAGHQMMAEAPDAVLFALRDFLPAHEPVTA